MAYEYIFYSGLTRMIPTPEPSLSVSLPRYNLQALVALLDQRTSSLLILQHPFLGCMRCHVRISAAHFAIRPSFPESFSIFSIGPSVTTLTLCFSKIDLRDLVGTERTTIPRFMMEHQLRIYPFIEPVVHKKRPMTPDGRLILKKKVFRWLKEGMIKKVWHPMWVTNTIPIKLENKTWKVQVDYSSLNKVCAKDMYPFSEEEEGLTSIMGYLYKCFLRPAKEYIQIRMIEDNEEKTGFHTEEGVYCFTHMPKELKNLAATLQRMMEKVLAERSGCASSVPNDGLVPFSTADEDATANP
nr:hypothetical protein [Tanacetum cinerariifolium]